MRILALALPLLALPALALASTAEEKLDEVLRRLDRLEAAAARPAPAVPQPGRFAIVARPTDLGSNFTECAILVMDTATGATSCHDKRGKLIGTVR